MKKIYKILKIFLVLTIVFIAFSNVINASTVLDLYQDTDVGTDGIDEITNIINISIGVIQAVGIFIATAMLIILGIKYLVASPGEKAEIKKHLVVYVVGAIVLFGVAGILEIVETFALDVTATS